MMQNSFRCCVFGLLGLLPLIGIPFAVVALVIAGNVRVAQRRYWNPARPYWISGMVCAAAGLIYWSMIVTVILYHTTFSD